MLPLSYSPNETLLGRRMELNTGEVAQHSKSETLANLNGVEFVSKNVQANGKLHSYSVSYQLGYLNSIYVAGGQQVGRKDWRCRLSVSRSAAGKPSNESFCRKLVEQVLPELEVSIPLVPWDLISRTAVSDLQTQDIALVQNYLPEALQLGSAAQAVFGDLFVALAKKLQQAQETDQQITADTKADKRRAKQFLALPAGTVMISSWPKPQVGILSDKRGARTKRTLEIKHQSGNYSQDIQRQAREEFKLLTKDRASDVPPGILSAHEIMKAVNNAELIRDQFPDLVTS